MECNVSSSAETIDIARCAFARHQALHGLGHYTGILSLHALARLAVTTGEADTIALAQDQLREFLDGKHRFAGNFPNYQCGGNGAALMLWKGYLPEAERACREHAELIMDESPRNADGLLRMPGANPDLVWIDAAFAATPYLLFTGLALDEPQYVEEAHRQIAGMAELLRDRSNSLLHQTHGFCGRNCISQDHWSRGNGWALLAMAELVAWLPDKHTLRDSAEYLFMDLLTACLCFQDDEGVWHQELTEPSTSYVETSGTGLILFALGVAIERGLLPDSCRERLRRGLRGYRNYIDEDGAIRHTCRGCLCPGDGSIEAYKKVPHVPDDPHAFGPAILAFGQAHHLGILTVGR